MHLSAQETHRKKKTRIWPVFASWRPARVAAPEAVLALWLAIVGPRADLALPVLRLPLQAPPGFWVTFFLGAFGWGGMESCGYSKRLLIYGVFYSRCLQLFLPNSVRPWSCLQAACRIAALPPASSRHKLYSAGGALCPVQRSAPTESPLGCCVSFHQMQQATSTRWLPWTESGPSCLQTLRTSLPASSQGPRLPLRLS